MFDNIFYDWIFTYIIFYPYMCYMSFTSNEKKYYIYLLPFLLIAFTIPYFIYEYMQGPAYWRMEWQGGMMIIVAGCMAFYTALVARQFTSRIKKILAILVMFALSMLPPAAVWQAGIVLQNRMEAPPPAFCAKQPLRLDFNGTLATVQSFRLLRISPSGELLADVINKNGFYDLARNYDYTTVCLSSAKSPVPVSRLAVNMLPDEPKDFAWACNALVGAKDLKSEICDPPPDLEAVVNTGLPGILAIHNAKTYEPEILGTHYDSFEQYRQFVAAAKHDPKRPISESSPFIINLKSGEQALVSYADGENFEVSILIKWSDDIIVEIGYLNPGKTFDALRFSLTYVRGGAIVEGLGFQPVATDAKAVP